ncbi:MAG: DUF2092 domain-containing protein [Chthoniobacterales bacterium]
MKQSTRLLLPFFAVIFFVGDALGQEVAVEAPDAAALLQEMAKTYAAADSYSDVSSAVYHNRDGSERLSVTFRIWFVRPSSFRVDAESKSPNSTTARREVLWTDGTTIRRWATDKPVSTVAKMQLAGSGMFGTYAYHIPTLLKESYGARRRLQELTGPKLVGVEELEGVACYQMSGDWSGDSYRVWIGREDHLVHKIMATYSDHDLEETHREIVLGQPIDPEIFRFAPEEEGVQKKAKKESRK